MTWPCVSQKPGQRSRQNWTPPWSRWSGQSCPSLRLQVAVLPCTKPSSTCWWAATSCSTSVKRASGSSTSTSSWCAGTPSATWWRSWSRKRSTQTPCPLLCTKRSTRRKTLTSTRDGHPRRPCASSPTSSSKTTSATGGKRSRARKSLAPTACATRTCRLGSPCASTALMGKSTAALTSRSITATCWPLNRCTSRCWKALLPRPRSCS